MSLTENTKKLEYCQNNHSPICKSGLVHFDIIFCFFVKVDSFREVSLPTHFYVKMNLMEIIPNKTYKNYSKKRPSE